MASRGRGRPVETVGWGVGARDAARHTNHPLRTSDGSPQHSAGDHDAPTPRNRSFKGGGAGQTHTDPTVPSRNQHNGHNARGALTTTFTEDYQPSTFATHTGTHTAHVSAQPNHISRAEFPRVARRVRTPVDTRASGRGLAVLPIPYTNSPVPRVSLRL